MKVGDWVQTPRFCGVRIMAILSQEEAYDQGFTEPTHYDSDPQYSIKGKSTGLNTMIFAAVKK